MNSLDTNLHCKDTRPFQKSRLTYPRIMLLCMHILNRQYVHFFLDNKEEILDKVSYPAIESCATYLCFLLLVCLGGSSAGSRKISKNIG